MEDSRPSLLLKANREIAEVREELAKLDVRVDEIQAKNANYLEEISLQDSEVTRLCARAALSEQKLAEAFQQKRDGQQLREEKQAAREAELSKLRESLREKEEALAQVIIPKETDVGVDVPQADPRELRSELRALESKESAQKSLLETSRQQAAKLTKDIAKERQRMEELHRALRKASEDAASCEENEKALKVAITSKGVDPAQVDEAEKEAERVTEELRSELASAEEKCQELRSKLAATTKKGAEDVKDLELTLSSAREDLQRSLEQVREAQRAEAAHAESKMQAERQRANLETLGTNALREQIDKLHESLRKAKASPPKPQGGLMSLLEEDLRRIKQQASNAEQQAEEKAKELLRTKQQQRDVQVQAEEEAIQVKAKIQEIWRHLAAG